MKSLIFRQKDGFPRQFVEFLFAIGSSWIQPFGDVPIEVRPRRDDVPVHGPVMVFAKGEAVGGMVVVIAIPRQKVGGVDEGDVVTGGKPNAKATGGALVVVDIEDESAEGGRAAVFEGGFRDAERFDFRLMIVDC